MNEYTNSETVIVHDDGSKTVKTEYTVLPMTQADKAALVGGYAVLGLIVLSPVILTGYEMLQEKRAARKAAKTAKAV